LHKNSLKYDKIAFSQRGKSDKHEFKKGVSNYFWRLPNGQVNGFRQVIGKIKSLLLFGSAGDKRSGEYIVGEHDATGEKGAGMPASGAVTMVAIFAARASGRAVVLGA
jgi:hypothetical protein